MPQCSCALFVQVVLEKAMRYQGIERVGTSEWQNWLALALDVKMGLGRAPQYQTFLSVVKRPNNVWTRS